MQKKYFIYFGLAVVLIISSAFIFPNIDAKENSIAQNDNTAKVELASYKPDETIKWYTVNEALELQKVNHKKMFIDVFTVWCGPCKMLSSNTFTNPTISKLLTDYYIPTKFNAEGNDTIAFAGKTYINPAYSTTPRTSTHQFAFYIAQTPQGLAYPTMVFLDEDLNMIQPITGYLTPQQLEPILSFFGTNAYKTTQWDAYMSTFVSAISQ